MKMAAAKIPFGTEADALASDGKTPCAEATISTTLNLRQEILSLIYHGDPKVWDFAN